MKLKIFTTVTNQPEFASLQAQTFKEFLECDYEFHLIDDSSDNLNISEKFKNVCQSSDIVYHRKPDRVTPHDPMMGCSYAVTWTYENFISKCSDDIVLFLDSDMFLLKKFNPIKYMKDKVLSGSIHIREHVNYIWNGIVMFNMPKVLSLKGNLDFSCGYVDGVLTDVGGHTYHFIKENQLEVDDIQPTYGGSYNGIELENMETFIDGTFFHFRGGTLWDRKADVYERKLLILNQILDTL